jgi:hypothetical protein
MQPPTDQEISIIQTFSPEIMLDEIIQKIVTFGEGAEIPLLPREWVLTQIVSDPVLQDIMFLLH